MQSGNRRMDDATAKQSTQAMHFIYKNVPHRFSDTNAEISSFAIVCHFLDNLLNFNRFGSSNCTCAKRIRNFPNFTDCHLWRNQFSNGNDFSIQFSILKILFYRKTMLIRECIRSSGHKWFAATSRDATAAATYTNCNKRALKSRLNCCKTIVVEMQILMPFKCFLSLTLSIHRFLATLTHTQFSKCLSFTKSHFVCSHSLPALVLPFYH